MVKTAGLSLLVPVLFLVVRCSDFPLPYQEKEKDFEPTVHFLFPEDGDTLAFADPGYIVAITNDVEQGAERLEIECRSDIAGRLECFTSSKYGQSLIPIRLLSYNTHNIDLTVTDKSGQKKSDRITLHCIKPDKIRIVESARSKKGVQLKWSKSRIPSSFFRSYTVVCHENDSNEQRDIEVVKVTDMNDTTYLDPDLRLNNYSYSVILRDIRNHISSSDTVTIRADEPKSFSLSMYSPVKKMIYDDLRRVLYLATHSHLLILDPQEGNIVHDGDYTDRTDFDINEDSSALFINDATALYKFDLGTRSHIRQYDTDAYKMNAANTIGKVLCGKKGRLFLAEEGTHNRILLIDTENGEIKNSLDHRLSDIDMDIGTERKYLFVGESRSTRSDLVKYNVTYDFFVFNRQNKVSNLDNSPVLIGSKHGVYFAGRKWDYETLSFLCYTNENIHYVPRGEHFLISETHILSADSYEEIAELPFATRIITMSNDSSILFLYNKENKHLYTYFLENTDLEKRPPA